VRLEHIAGAALAAVLIAIGLWTLSSQSITLPAGGRRGLTLPGEERYYVLPEWAALLFGALFCLLGVVVVWLTYCDWRELR
jgi:hypothetical protein